MRKPEIKDIFLRLVKYEATEERLANVVKTLRSPDCSIERLELFKASFTDKSAAILATGLSMENSLKEIIFDKCRLKFG